jgi:plastocyanin domain-containing protein
MNTDFLIVNAIAVVLLAFVYWWFFGSNPEAFWSDDKLITVLVKDGTYQPSVIQIPAGHPMKIVFIRKDPTMCAETVFFPELKISYQLPIDQPVEITIPPQSQGQLNFTCQMGMYRGKIIVV